MQPGTLLTKTREKFENRPRTLTMQRIAKDTGLAYHWIAQFSSDRGIEPGVNKVQVLYEYLTGEKLAL